MLRNQDPDFDIYERLFKTTDKFKCNFSFVHHQKRFARDSLSINDLISTITKAINENSPILYAYPVSSKNFHCNICYGITDQELLLFDPGISCFYRAEAIKNIEKRVYEPDKEQGELENRDIAIISIK